MQDLPASIGAGETEINADDPPAYFGAGNAEIMITVPRFLWMPVRATSKVNVFKNFLFQYT